MATRMLQRRGTAAEWASLNPVLADGEIGVARDTGVFKIGNGETPWNDLEVPYAPANVSVPVGGIIMYSGDGSELSSAWRICNGTGGTPDLRNRFVVGSGGEYSTGDTGGAKEVALSTAQMPSHTHTGPSHAHGSGTLSADNVGNHNHAHLVRSFTTTGTVNHDHSSTVDRSQNASTQGGNDTQNSNVAAGAHGHNVSGSTASAGTGATGSAGSGTAHENRPPYYALAYIMRVS